MPRAIAPALLLLGGCLSTQQRVALAKHYRDHPMDECRDLIAEEDTRRSMRQAQAHFRHVEPPIEPPINPCALGCRIPVCGYPAAKAETVTQ